MPLRHDECPEASVRLLHRSRSAAAKERCLRSADGPVSLIVQDEELDRQFQTSDRFQFLNVELESSIPIHANDIALCTAVSYAHNARSHRWRVSRSPWIPRRWCEKCAAALGAKCEKEELNSSPRTAGDTKVAFLAGCRTSPRQSCRHSPCCSGALCSGSTRG